MPSGEYLIDTRAKVDSRGPSKLLNDFCVVQYDPVYQPISPTLIVLNDKRLAVALFNQPKESRNRIALAGADVDDIEHPPRNGHPLGHRANIFQVYVIAHVTGIAENPHWLTVQHAAHGDANQSLHPMLRKQCAIGISHTHDGSCKRSLRCR